MKKEIKRYENEVNKLVDKILKKLSDLGAQLRE